MSTLTKGDAALYRGKKYRVEYIGPTKYGRRAKLSWFSDADKSFWVDADKVSAASQDSANGRTSRVFYGRNRTRTFDTGNWVRECGCGHKRGIWNNGSRSEPDWVCPNCM